MTLSDYRQTRYWWLHVAIRLQASWEMTRLPAIKLERKRTQREMLRLRRAFRGDDRSLPVLKLVPTATAADRPDPGDEALSVKLNAYCASGDFRVQLRKLAEANALWKPQFESADNGRLRMTIGNSLRGKLRRGEAIIWPTATAKRA